MVVTTNLVRAHLGLPDEPRDGSTSDNYLQGATLYGVILPDLQEIWVPPATGRSHHITLRLIRDEEVRFVGCIPDMTNPYGTLRPGDTITTYAEPNEYDATCYGAAGGGYESDRHLYESGPARVVSVVQWSAFGSDFQYVTTCATAGDRSDHAMFILMRIRGDVHDDWPVWWMAARLSSGPWYTCDGSAP